MLTCEGRNQAQVDHMNAVARCAHAKIASRGDDAAYLWRLGDKRVSQLRPLGHSEMEKAPQARTSVVPYCDVIGRVPR